VPANWRDDALATKWAEIRETRRLVTTAIEAGRNDGRWGSSLQVQATLNSHLLNEDEWAEVLIVSNVRLVPADDNPVAHVEPAAGEKCARCWRVLPEVGQHPGHPSLCLRCADAVESSLVCQQPA